MVVVPEQPGSTVPLTEQSTGLLFAAPLMLMVAEMVTPLASVCTCTGSGLPNNCLQLRPFAPYEKTNRCARKVKSEFATAGSGDGRPVVKAMFSSSCKRCGATASRLLQYVLVLASCIVCAAG